METSNRINYFDISKGLMILGLLISHFTICAGHIGVSSGHRYIDMFVSFYSGFFMQCFFFISGYCSSFCIDSKGFFAKLLRQLILPLCFFDVAYMILDAFDVKFANSVFERPMCFTSLWFVRSLIIAKIIVWFLQQICKSDYVLLFATFALLIVGVALNDFHLSTNETEFFCYCHGLLASFFVALGVFFKRHRKLYDIFLKYGWIVYLFVLLVRYYSKTTVFQSFDANINFGLYQIVPMLFLTISGLFACLMLSKLISCNRLLEFYGKNSLIVYCVHIIPLYYITRFVFFELNPGWNFFGAYYLLFLIAFVLTSLTMAIFIALFTKTPLKKCIGK